MHCAKLCGCELDTCWDETENFKLLLGLKRKLHILKGDIINKAKMISIVYLLENKRCNGNL